MHMCMLGNGVYENNRLQLHIINVYTLCAKLHSIIHNCKTFDIYIYFDMRLIKDWTSQFKVVACESLLR